MTRFSSSIGQDGQYRGLRGERLHTMTVGELRDVLEGEDDDTLVIASCDYGDYHHTEQVVPLGEPTWVHLSGSAYSQSGFQVHEGEPDEDELPTRICPDCDGEGEWPMEEGQPPKVCVTCEGRGELPAIMPKVLCLRGM